MKHDEITGLMRSLAPTIGDFVGKAMAPLRAENERLSSSLAAFEQRFADFTAARENDKVFVLTLVKEEVAKIELPAAEVDPVEIERVVSEKVEKAVSALPVAVNGKDADPVDPTVVANLLVDLMPVPKDGRDGVDGKSVTLEEVAPLIEEAVSKIVVADGQKGEDGKSITVDDVKPMLEELVAAIQIPVPENGKDGRDGRDGMDGKSVTVDDVRPVIEEAVAAIEPAKDGRDGKDADPVEIAALIAEDVAKLVPVPADGKSVTIGDVAPLIEDAVSKRLPNSLLVNEEGVLVAVYPSGELKSVGRVRGEDGLRGASVMDGQVEEDGTLVLRMSDGRIIQTGRVKGDNGKDGEDGQKGDRGRDAHEIQILAGVDEHKSYVEGVVALWRGGMIRAERQTDPIVDGDILAAGWKACLRGIAEQHEDYIEDGRFIEKTTVFTDGTEFKQRHKTVTPIHKGVWKEGEAYLKGDQVTWAGSMFIAQRDTSDKPETTDAFRLSTKRGRDGRDGKPPVGPVGPVKAR
jgi:hypothetical protein